MGLKGIGKSKLKFAENGKIQLLVTLITVHVSSDTVEWWGIY